MIPAKGIGLGRLCRVLAGRDDGPPWCAEVDLGSDAAGEFQGATGTRLQTELQVDVELQAALGLILRGASGVGVDVGFPETTNSSRSTMSGGSSW